MLCTHLASARAPSTMRGLPGPRSAKDPSAACTCQSETEPVWAYCIQSELPGGTKQLTSKCSRLAPDIAAQLQMLQEVGEQLLLDRSL